MQSFPDRLAAAIRRKRSCVVVGLDPRLALLPAPFRRARGTRAAAAAIRAFNRAVLDIVAPYAVAVKPQVAFYECLGTHGMAAFADALESAARRGLLTIADVKRGDVPSTAEAYAAAYLGNGPGAAPAPFAADAVTLSPYLGRDSVEPFLAACARRAAGAFFLVRTSNPGARDFQDLSCGGRPLYRAVARAVHAWGEGLRGKSGLSAVGAVVGATYPREAAVLRRDLPHAFFLVPGYGAQGAGAAEVRPCFLPDGLGALVSASRSVTFAWTVPPWKTELGEARWERAIEAAAGAMRREVEAVRRPIVTRTGRGAR